MSPLRTMVLLLLAAAIPSAHAENIGSETFEKDKRPPVDITKDRVLFMVGYAHLDTQWRWTYPQVVREFISNTLQHNFTLFEKYPNYIFNFSGSRRYEMMKEYYPADYERLKKFVADGRWFPCGSSVDEGDAIVPSVESMVRHVLYGNRFFQQEFGMASAEFMLPDCFGFPASLPSILAHCGIKGFSTQKLTWGSAIGIPFKVGTWTGPDGASVVAALDPGEYVGQIKADLSKSESWLQRIQTTGAASGAFVDYHYFGTGDRGGAPSQQSVKWVEASLAGQGPVRVVSSKAEEMFKLITPEQKAKLPNYKGELLLTKHSAGSITSQAYMKRWNRKSELLADAAERASVAALWLGQTAYPSQKLYEAWDLILGSQMHDMLPGTSVPKAYEYCWNDYILAQNKLAAVETDAIAGLASQMDTRAVGVPLVVYNPLSISREDVVEADVTFEGDAPASVRVVGPDGAEVPAQVGCRNGKTARVIFVAKVPPVGVANYDVQPAKETPASALKASESARTIENAHYRVRLNETGDIASIFDKIHSKELLAAPARLAFQYEKPKEYPAWNMDWEDRQKPPRAYVDGPAKVRVVEMGPARAALEIDRTSQGSHFIQQIRLDAGAGDIVEVVNKIAWATPESSLKAEFPLSVSNPQATYDDKVGTVVRGNNEPKRFEVPQQRWFDLTDSSGSYGVAILNDSKFGSDKPADNLMRLTLLFTPGVRMEYQDEASQDFGQHEILYGIAGHAGDWKKGGVAWQGARLNQPLRAFRTAAHPGKIGRSFSAIRCNDAQVEVVALKKAEEGNEIVMRLRELTGQPASNVRIGGPAAIVAAREIDGQEKALCPARMEKGELVVNAPAYGLRAFAVRFAPPASGAADSGSSLAAKKWLPVRSRPVDLPFDLDACSSDEKRADGAFDSEGRSYPAPQMPKEIEDDGIVFKMGPKGAGEKNAVVCRGQRISLPEGEGRIYLLASAVGGDVQAAFGVGETITEATVGDWRGYLGQWDNRLWKGNIPEIAYQWPWPMDGLLPGFTKQCSVAWYASHHHQPSGDAYYQYCYLFKIALNRPPGAKFITLPNNDRVRVFALSVASGTHPEVVPARPLYDTLEDHVLAAPSFSPAAGRFDQSIAVTASAVYWQPGCIHYTVDGSEPTSASPVFNGALALSTPTTLKARVILPDGRTGPLASERFDVNDVTPPAVIRVESLLPAQEVLVDFSESVTTATAQDVANYRLEPANPLVKADLMPGGTRVKLTFAQPISGECRLTVTGVVDCSPKANPVLPQSLPVLPPKQVFAWDSLVCDGTSSKSIPVAGLPTKAGDSWTINAFVRCDSQPDNRTLVAGFGSCEDNPGFGRYLAKFANGVHFWSSMRDVESLSPLDVGPWQMLSATYDGEVLRLYKNGEVIGERSVKLSDDDAVVNLAPLDPWDKKRRFKGEIRSLTIWSRQIPQEGLKELYKGLPK